MSGFRRPNISMVKEPEEKYFPVRGGLDLITPHYQIAEGKMIDCFRYEIAPSGGAKPIDGYERVDGRGLPSEAVYQFVTFTDSGIALADDTEVTGSLSGAIGISLCSGEIDFTGSGETTDITGSGVFLVLSGAFVEGDELIVSGPSTVAVVDVPYSINTEEIATHERYYRWLAVERFRQMIEEVPGSGRLLGVWKYNDVLYAFRNNADGTEAVMFKEDATSGWVAVTTPTLDPDGYYKFINSNFGGSARTMKMYGIDRVNKGFEFDGSTFTQITTGMAVDAPIDIAEHALHLFFAFPDGSLQHSPPTDPTGTWTVVTGAGELGMGDDLHGIKSLPGGTLGIWSKDSVNLLYGTGVGTWDLQNHTKTSGGVSGTIQDCGNVLYLNKTGIAKLSATSSYGNFKAATISGKIQPLLDVRKSRAISSVAVNSKNQYRLFFDDGYCITATFNANNEAEFTQSHYDDIVRCISAPKRAGSDVEEIYFGSDDGYVYKMDSGVSLDDTPMSAYFRMPYAHHGSPRRKKRFREIAIELDQFSGNVEGLSLFPDFSFANRQIPQHKMVDVSWENISAAIWDLGEWDMFNWSDETTSNDGSGLVSARVDGVSSELGLMFYFNAPDTVTPLHIINGIFTYFNYLGRRTG